MAKFNVESYVSFFGTFEAKASWALASHHVEEVSFETLDEEGLDFFSVGVSSADSYMESGTSAEHVEVLSLEEEAEWASYRARCAVWEAEARLAHAAHLEELEARARWELAYGKKSRR